MKKLYFLLLLLCCSAGSYAQMGNVVVFTERGERFVVILNGQRQNRIPQTLVQVYQLTHPTYRLRILFKNRVLGIIDQHLHVRPGYESSYSIRPGRRGYTLRLVSEVPIFHPGDYAYWSRVYPPAAPPVRVTPPSYEPDYASRTACDRPMLEEDFEQAIHTITGKMYEESRLSIAKQVVQSNCLLSSHVLDILMLFSSEQTRLYFAKYAYEFTYDQNNYFKVNNAFEYERSVDELNGYIGSAR